MHWAHLNKETIWLFIEIIVDLTGNFNDDCGHNVTVMAQPLQEELCAVLDAQPFCWIKWRLWVTVIGHLPCNSILELFLKTTKTGKCQRHYIRKGQATLLHSLITFIPFINSANKGILKRFLKLSVAYIFKRIVIYSLGKNELLFLFEINIFIHIGLGSLKFLSPFWGKMQDSWPGNLGYRCPWFWMVFSTVQTNSCPLHELFSFQSSCCTAFYLILNHIWTS